MKVHMKVAYCKLFNCGLLLFLRLYYFLLSSFKSRETVEQTYKHLNIFLKPKYYIKC